MMLGCLSSPATVASLRKRAVNWTSPAYLGFRILRAMSGQPSQSVGGQHPRHPAPAQQGGDGVRTDGLADQRLGCERQKGPLSSDFAVVKLLCYAELDYRSRPA